MADIYCGMFFVLMQPELLCFFFFFNDTATTEIYTLSLHDALPISERPSLNKECGWKGGDRSGLAHGQELSGRKRRTKTSFQEEKEKKQKNTLDSYRPSHGRTYPAVEAG